MMVSGTLEMSETTSSGPRNTTVAGDTLTFSTVSAPPRRGESTMVRSGTLRSMSVSTLMTIRGGWMSTSSKARKVGPRLSPPKGTTVTPFLMSERSTA